MNKDHKSRAYDLLRTKDHLKIFPKTPIFYTLTTKDANGKVLSIKRPKEISVNKIRTARKYQRESKETFVQLRKKNVDRFWHVSKTLNKVKKYVDQTALKFMEEQTKR